MLDAEVNSVVYRFTFTYVLFSKGGRNYGEKDV